MGVVGIRSLQGMRLQILCAIAFVKVICYERERERERELVKRQLDIRWP